MKSYTTYKITVELTKLEARAAAADWATSIHWRSGIPEQEKLIRARRRARNKFDAAAERVAESRNLKIP